MNKKAISLIMNSLVGIILLVTFFLGMLYITEEQGKALSDGIDDNMCRLYIEGLGTNPGRVVDFFANFNLHCKKDKFRIETNNREILFRQIADSMLSCWNRYGEGEKDFLGHFNTNGVWCFTCARIEFSKQGILGIPFGDRLEEYEYLEFIEWLKINKPSQESEETYYNMMRVMYLEEFDEGEIEAATAEFFQDIQEIGNDPEFDALVVSLSQQYSELIDLRLKKINTNEDLYVVLKYHRPDPNVLQNVLVSMAVSVGAGMALDAVISIVSIGTAAPAAIARTTARTALMSTKFVQAMNIKIRMASVKRLSRATTVSSGNVDIAVDAARAARRNIEVATAGRLGSQSDRTNMLDRVSTFWSTTGAATGGFAGVSSGFQDEFFQYVDIVSQEQYYRQCGFEPPQASGRN